MTKMFFSQGISGLSHEIARSGEMKLQIDETFYHIYSKNLQFGLGRKKYSEKTQTLLALQVDVVGSHSSSWEHITTLKSVFVIKASQTWWNGPLMWSRQLFLLPESHPHTPAETPTRTHPPALVSPYIYLTALCAPSRTFMTVWFNQQRQIITFLLFL